MDVFDTFQGHLSSLGKYILGFSESPNAALNLKIKYFGIRALAYCKSLAGHSSLCQVLNFAPHSSSLITKLSPDTCHSEEADSVQTRPEVASFCTSYQSRDLISTQADASKTQSSGSMLSRLSVFFYILFIS